MTMSAAAETTTADWKPENPWACPDGELLLPYEASREDWLAARRGAIGASEIAAVFDMAKWEGADSYTVWAEKMGYVPGKERTRAMARGLIMEASVVELWLAEDVTFPIEVRRRGLMRARRNPVLAASLDFLSVCPEGRCCVEVKTQTDTRDWDDEQVPLEYQFQGQAQLFVTGRHHVHFIAMGHRFEIEHRIMYRDEALMEMIVTRLVDWWERHVLRNEAPPVTAKSLETVKRQFFQAEPGISVDLPADLFDAPVRETALKDQITALQVELDTLQAQVRAAAGPATILTIEGDPVGTLGHTRRLVGATKEFQKAHRELVGPYLEPKLALNAARLVAEHPELIEDGTLRYQRQLVWTV